MGQKNDDAYPSMAYARATDWICKTEDGKWIVLNNEEYEEATKTPKG